MKRTISAFLIGFALLLSAAGCGKQKSGPDPAKPQLREEDSGGYRFTEASEEAGEPGAAE